MKSIRKLSQQIYSFIENADKINKKTTLICIAVYTLIFAVVLSFTVLPIMSKTGSVLGSDGINQYYPFLLNFKECILSVADGISEGAFRLPMMNFGYGFGTDNIFTILNFLPFAPYFAFSAIVPDEHIALFLSIGVILLMYLSGLAFMALCRHFRKNLFYSGLFAVSYVFCGNLIFTGMLNPHFLYMYIAFPIFIIGADNIINRKGWKLFSAMVFWLSLSGFTLIIYTIPFVVIFAVIRSLFIHKNNRIKNLGISLLKGMGAFLIGILSAGIVIMPAVSDFMQSSRTSSIDFSNILSYLTPSCEYLNELFSAQLNDTATGAGVGALICFIILLTATRRHTELRMYSLGMIFLTVIPIVRYGLNGFQYALCRWGFIPAMVMCYSAVIIVPTLFKQKNHNSNVTIFCLSAYALGVTINLNTICNIAVFIIGLLKLVPFTGKLINKICRKVLSVSGAMSKKIKSIPKTLALVLVVFASVLIIAVILCIIMNKAYTLNISLLIAIILTVVLMIISGRSAKATVPLCLITSIAFVICNTVTVQFNIGRFFKVEENVFLQELSEKETNENYPGRYSCISREHVFTDTSLQSPGYNKDQQFSQALRYNIADADIFKSSIDKNYMNFLTRCGQDAGSVLSTGQISGFAAKEVIYSLFGIDTLYTYSDSNNTMYGLGLTETKSGDLYGENIYLYNNKYALPTGVTYDKLISENTFSNFNSAELPYAMMDTIYLEDYSGESYSATSGYSKKCDIDVSQQFRGETEHNMKCYDNIITVNDNVKGCFLYLAVNDTWYETFPETNCARSTIFADDKEVCRFYFSNDAGTWEWIYNTDFYTVSLGYFEDDIDKISFISEFQYKDIQLYSIPADIYHNAYENRMKETLENVRIGTNTLEGDLTVSKDRYLAVNYLYNKGWKAYVDGNEVPVCKANGIFLGIPVKEGTHNIKFVYRTPMLYEGALVSLVAVILLIIIPDKLKKTKKFR